ncbi:MAG: hypothetical protein M1823_001610 [Watsoniomyces obsoletus]|nr:MAG: hypothetical protein M1823_001610 [Watsoniomyces obsoletus]
MSYQQPAPHLGATFTPGGSDDFYLPEVISPAPQRVMPEVPGNMQQNLAHFELEAGGVSSPTAPNGPPSHFPGRGDSLSGGSSAPPSIRQGPANAPDSAYNYPHDHLGYGTPAQPAHQHPVAGPRREDPSYQMIEPPRFSPFPQLHNPPPNVPPSDEEKEATLEQARVHVLNSDDPEMQLAWAQDALAYVEVSMQHEARMADQQPTRPQTPQIEHQLRIDAVSIVSFLADQHHPRAEFMRGMWLEFGKFGVRIDKKEAHRCYARAAEKGYARAEYRMGMQFETSFEPAKAIKHYQRGVALGDSASRYRLGMMVLLGQHGQQQDYPRGLEHIRFAADTADENAPQGAYVYGMLLARELEAITIPEQYLPQDLHEARVYLEKAAYLGFAKAQVKMGAAYELCQLGCEFNPALSLHYNALAARQGESAAEMAVSKWFLCGYEGIFEKNEELAFVFAQRAARSGLPTAEFAMGYFYEIGMYVPVNVQEARRWYERAADHGNRDAMGRIDGISRSKTLSKKDHEQVAIQRIKSQYGSQRGRRPARFSKNSGAEPMPSIPDGRLAMPEPPSVQHRQSHLSQPGAGGPPRTQSAMGGAPYPMDGGMGRVGPRPGTATGFVPSHGRASSAMAMTPPQVRPATTSIPESPHLGQQQQQRPRPMPAGADLGPGSDPYLSARPRPASINSQAAGAGRLSPGSQHPAPGRPSTMDPNYPPRLDIGFSAPPDPNADRRARLHKPPRTPSVNNKPLPDVHSTPPQSPRLSSRPSIPGQQPGVGLSPRPPSAQSMGAPPQSSRPPRLRPVSSDPMSILPEERWSTPSTPASSSAASQASKPPLHPAAVAPRPPGKGPKTFEEMGVPQTTEKSECAVM